MSHQRLTTIANTWTKLYKRKDHTTQLFNLEGTLAEFTINDSKLSVEEICVAAKALKAGKCPGPISFHAETMKKSANGKDGSADHTAS
jgi:hypothetical protein